MKDKINNIIYKRLSLVYSFLESMEGERDTFCDCPCLEGCHAKDCRSMLLQQDIDNVEAELSLLRNEVNKVWEED